MSLFAFGPSRGPRWQIGVQAALGMTVPIAVMTLLGQPRLGYIAASGAFTVLFVSTAPVVDRLRVLPFVAGGLIVSAALGAAAAGAKNVVVADATGRRGRPVSAVRAPPRRRAAPARRRPSR